MNFKIKNTIFLSLLALVTSLSAFASNITYNARVVYIESNIASSKGNSILAYHYDSSGKLSPIPGSPFLTGGAGVVDSTFAIGPFDSDQNLVTDDNKQFLFSVNSGSNSIAAFHIRQDGSLTTVAGSPFFSHGVQPVSLGYQNGYLTVVNKHQDPAQAQDMSLPNYIVFRVAADGSLAHVANADTSVAVGSSPSQALSHGDFTFGADFMGGLLQSFVFQKGKLLQNKPTPIPDSVFTDKPGAPHFPLGLALNPAAPLLYVGLPTVSRLGVFRYNGYGALRFLNAVENSGKAICWLRANKEGTRLYSSNTGDKSISVYGLANPTNPVETQHLALSSAGGLFQLSLDPEEHFVFVVEQRDKASIPQGSGNSIHVLKIGAEGSLSELSTMSVPLSLPGDTRPQGILVL